MVTSALQAQVLLFAWLPTVELEALHSFLGFWEELVAGLSHPSTAKYRVQLCLFLKLIIEDSPFLVMG